MIYAPSVGEEQVTKFETVFSAVRYIRFDALLKKNQLWYMNLTTDKKLKIIILIFIHIHTQNKPIDSGKRTEKEIWW